MMSGMVFEKAIVLSKFRGSLVGGLLGDCLGAAYEGDESVNKRLLQRYFDGMEGQTFKSPLKQYTDDTAMTKAIASSLAENGALNESDIAKRFVKNYFSEPGRGYGEGVITVFHKLRQSKFVDIWKPASEQFNGTGSLGNGGAMRVSPVALFCCKNYDLMLDVAEKCTKITHTHKLGVRGALLQAIAVQQSFLTPPDQEIDVRSFTSDLIKKMDAIESADDDSEYANPLQPTGSYKQQLEEMSKLLEKPHVEDVEVVGILGNSIRALYSVPTAIYCFLRAQKPIPSIETENKLTRAVQYSISLGGDTDTIASMTGSIAGAYHGYDYISKPLQSYCEGVQDITNLADELFNSAPI